MINRKLPLEGEIRIKIPKDLISIFEGEPRIVIKWRPDGLYPIDPGMLKSVVEKLVSNPEFNQKYEIVIMERR